MLTKDEIKNFLKDVKECIDNNNYSFLSGRYKNNQTLARLGLIFNDVLNDIQNLTVNENWSKKQDDNPNFPGDVWICTKALHNTIIYIKLKIIKDKSGKMLLIMSYHFGHI